MGTETSWHYDIGLYHKFGKGTEIKVAGYYVDITDYMASNTGGIYYSSSYGFTIPSVKYYGFEAEFNVALIDRLNVFGNYAYKDSQYEKPGNLAPGAAAPYIELPPKHKGTLGIRYDLPYDIRLTSDIKYVGERKTEGLFTLDDYITVDIGASKTFCKYFKASVFANNILGEEYQEIYGFPMPRQTFGLKMELTY